MTQDYITEFREKFPESYRTLELAGHIQNGSVSEVVNWDEIESFITKLVAEAEQRGRDEAVDYVRDNYGWPGIPKSEMSVNDIRLKKVLESARTKQS